MPIEAKTAVSHLDAVVPVGAKSGPALAGAPAGLSEITEREAILAGLAAPAAHIAPKYFYDALGSHLFEAITELPEYYPTRTERAIFRDHAPAMAAAAGTGRTLIDLGAGNCEKAAGLFGALRPAAYVAIDISADFLSASLSKLQGLHPDIPMQALAQDFSAGLALPATVAASARLFFYPGSSLGNFTPTEALRMLQDVRTQCGTDGALLIGIDLVKEAKVLQAAYDDELGVTAAFNLNMLSHLNTLVGSNFKPREWRHHAVYNSAQSRIEMHLEARRALTVSWPGGGRDFAAGARIHTESSYKYHLDNFTRLLGEAGFGGVTAWTDERSWFAVFLASVTGAPNCAASPP